MAYGDGKMPFVTAGQRFASTLERVLWIPELSENLFSLCKALDRGCRAEFNNRNSDVSFYRIDRLVLSGEEKAGENFFLMTFEPKPSRCSENVCALIGASLMEWHKRLGHCSIEKVKSLIRTGAVRGLNVSEK